MGLRGLGLDNKIREAVCDKRYYLVSDGCQGDSGAVGAELRDPGHEALEGPGGEGHLPGHTGQTPGAHARDEGGGGRGEAELPEPGQGAGDRARDGQEGEDHGRVQTEAVRQSE